MAGRKSGLNKEYIAICQSGPMWYNMFQTEREGHKMVNKELVYGLWKSGLELPEKAWILSLCICIYSKTDTIKRLK